MRILLCCGVIRTVAFVVVAAAVVAVVVGKEGANASEDCSSPRFAVLVHFL